MLRNLYQKTFISLTLVSLLVLILVQFALAAPAQSYVTVTANPPGAIGGNFRILYQDPTGNYQNVTQITPQTFTVMPGSWFLIYKIQSPINGFSYGGSPAITGTAGVADTTTTVTLAYQKKNQTITVGTHAPVSAAYNATFTVAATASSGLSVAYSSSGGCTNLGPVFTMTSSTVSCTVMYNQAGDANYNAAPEVTETVTAHKANQTITFVQPTSPTAYGTLFTVAPAADSSLPVTLVASGGCSITGFDVTMTSSTDNCILTASQAGNANYNEATPVSKEVTAQKALLTVTANDKTKVYGASLPSFDAGYTGFVLDEDESDLGGTLACETTAIASSPVTISPYPITCSGLTSTNYAIGYVDGKLAITPAPLTVTASDDTMVYGGTVPAITPSYTGLQAGDLAPATPPTCSTLATSISDVGPYASSCSSAADGNYTITYAAGSVDVTPAPLTVTASDDTMVYGGTVPTITPVYSGLQAGDTAPATPPTCSTAATNTSEVGPYASSCSGAVDANYTISYAPGSVSVTKASQAITFTSPPSPAAYHTTFNVNPTASSGLPVTLVASGGCTNTAFAVTMTSSTLTCDLTASQPGNGNYNAAADVVQHVAAKKADQAITFDAPSTAAYHSTFNVNPTANSGLAVSLTASGVCTYNAGVVTITASSGDCTLKASQAGDENYNPATDVMRVVVAMKASQAITFDQPASPVTPGAVFTVNPTSNSGLVVTLVAEGACVSNGFEVTAGSVSGTCTLTAKQAGDENYNPATDVVHTVEVVALVDQMNKVYLPAIQKQ